MAHETSQLPSSEDALDLLSIDQDEILELFERYEALAADAAPASRRRELAEEICSLLAVNAQVKQEILYPAARDALSDETPIEEAIAAHDSIEALVADVQSGDPDEPRYDATVRILQELVAQSIDEERRVLFPKLRESTLDLEELGGELGAREEVLLGADEELD